MNGKLCELRTCFYLLLRGYIILDRNYHSRFGEIDIIARKKDTVVFVEVKARGENAFYQPAFAVDVYKQRKIIKTAQFYLINKKYDDMDIRFDVVELFKKGKRIRINHIINAFEV